jgi:hypothetical protein
MTEATQWVSRREIVYKTQAAVLNIKQHAPKFVLQQYCNISQVSDLFQISHSWLQVTRAPTRQHPRVHHQDSASSQEGMSISLELARYDFVTIL